MIISDLQHIEFTTEIKVQGGRGGYCKPPRGWGGEGSYNAAIAEEEVFGGNTETSTTTDTLEIQ